jgi:hypothetical protein
MSRPLPDSDDRARRRADRDGRYDWTARAAIHPDPNVDPHGLFEWIAVLNLDKLAVCVCAIALAVLLIVHR